MPLPRPQSVFSSLAELEFRIRFLAAVLVPLFVVGMACWFYPFDDTVDRSGTPLGGDYVMLYIAGATVRDGAVDLLYDETEQLRRLQQLFPTLDPMSCRLPFRYPPILAIMMVPLASFPYAVSFAIFSLLSIVAGLMALRNLLSIAGMSESVGRGESSNRSRPWARITLLATVSWPVVIETVLGGQLSLFGLGILTWAIRNLERGHLVWGGAILGFACYKPNLLAFVGLGLWLRFPRAVLGTLATAVLVAVLQWTCAGWQSLLTYVSLGRELALGSWQLETPFWKVHGLASWLTIAWPGRERKALLVVGTLLTAAVAGYWRRSTSASSEARCLALLVIVNTLFNPYVPIYDLSLLSLPAFLLAGMATRNQTATVTWQVQSLILLAYLGPHLSQALAPLLGVQLFPWLLVLIAGCIVREGLRQRNNEPLQLQSLSS